MAHRGLSGHETVWQTMALEVERALAALGVEGIALHRQDAARTEEEVHRTQGSVWSPSREDVLRSLGGRCHVTGRFIAESERRS